MTTYSRQSILSDAQATLDLHTPDPGTGRCRACGDPCCPRREAAVRVFTRNLWLLPQRRPAVTHVGLRRVF